MPSETMKSRGFSPSSFFSDELCFSDERQVGARKMDHMTSYSGLKSDGSLRAEGVSSNSEMEKGFGLPEYYLNRGRNSNMSIGKHVVGAESEASRSLPSVCNVRGARSNLEMESASYFIDGNRVNLMGTQYENGLFSSSLSDLFSRNLKLSLDSAHGHSVGVGAANTQYEEEETFESLEEIEAQTIGNLLPDDDDLFSGVTDGLDSVIQSRNGEDMDDIDLFSNVGGLELGEDGFSRRTIEISDVKTNNQIGSGSYGEHPFGEHPSRTLFVRNINSNVEDAELRALFEQFGDVRSLYTACKHRGFVMISYFDIRAACNAMKAMQNKPLGNRKLDIHFSIPKDNPSEKDINTGTLVVFNLDPTVSNEELCKIFGGYGEIKEIRVASSRSSHKVVEYFDVRAAESALHALNKCDISGKQIKLEPGQPSGSGSARSTEPFSSELELEDSVFLSQQHSLRSNLETAFPGQLSLHETAAMNDNGLMGPRSTNGSVMSPLLDSALHHWISSSVPNSLSSTIRGEPGNKPTTTESGHMRNHLMFELSGSPNLHPHLRPDYHDNLANGPPFCSTNTMAANIHATEMIDGHQFRRVGSNMQSMELNEAFGSSGNGRHFIWNNSHRPQVQPIMWPGSPSFMNSINATRPQQFSVPRAPGHMMNGLMPSNNHNVGSAPSVNHSIWERRHSYTGEPTDAAVFHPGSLGNMRISGNSPHPLDFVHPNMFPRAGGNGMDVPITSNKSMGLHPHNQRGMIFPARGQMLPMMSSFDSPNERSRSRRNDGGSNMTDNKKQFELDIDRILRGEDKRTTLMLKNIPNKYTSKMLLAAIDERHKGTYDFIYLPIDFKNKCNVGYAFINMTDPSLIVPFHETFNGKKWEKFNSEKVASLAYARIQGKAALIAHFQNSSLMNEDRRCRPILFHTDGPNAGDQVPFPVGNNIRSRPGKVRGNTSEENSQEIPRNSSTGEDFSNGELSSGSGKELSD